MMDGKRVTVFGGSGFIGRTIVRELARLGAIVTVGCRDVEAAKYLKVMGNVGQITPVKADITDAGQIARALDGADHVVSLVGILHQDARYTFDAVQARGPALIAQAAADAGVDRLVHVSAIGADAGSKSAYARSKALGEAAVLERFAAAVVLRPGVVFGPDDDFFNRFAALACKVPALPLIGGGRTRFQPVYVLDVAAATVAALRRDGVQGKIYELGGPGIYDFRELMILTLAHAKRSRRLISIPFWLAGLQARLFELLPKPPLTRDQLVLLKSDNLVSADALGLADLGIEATPCEVVLPTYLDRFRPGGRYNRGRVSA